jgi:hypothetical protein
MALGFNSGKGKIFYLLLHIQTGSGVGWGSFLEVMQPDRKVNHSPLSPLSNVLRMSGAITLLPIHAFMAWIGETFPLHCYHEFINRSVASQSKNTEH